MTRGAKRLSRARTERGLTQRELGKRLGVCRSAVANWETGKSRPRTELALSLERIYGVPMRAWAERA